MPDGELPVVEPALVVESTQTLRVYSRTSLTASWELDTSLVCTGVTRTNNEDLGSATFFCLESGNSPSDYAEYQEDQLARRFNASLKYNVNLSGGYLQPYFVRVTALSEVNTGVEIPIFYGYISDVDADLNNERAYITALSYAGLLDQLRIVGGWYESTAGTAKYYFDRVPIFNPGGIGNKGAVTYSPSGYAGGYQFAVIDQTKLKETSTDANKYNAIDLIRMIWSLVDADTPSGDVQISGKPWACMKNLYTSLTPIRATDDALSKLEAAPALSDYKLQGRTVWEALVGLVTSVEGLAVTEDFDYGEPYIDSPQYIKIVDLRG